MARRTGGTIQKVLLPVAGRPFIDHKLLGLAAEGVDQVLLLLGHGGDAVADHVGDGTNYGLRVRYLPDGEHLRGTGGAVHRAIPLLGETFWVTYGDTILSVPIATAETAFHASGRLGLMTVLQNRDAWDRSNVAVRSGLVVEYVKGAPPGTYPFIDYGMNLLASAAFDGFAADTAFDLGEVLQRLIAQEQLAAFPVGDRFWEIGSEAGYAETDAHLRSLGGPPGRVRGQPEPTVDER